MASFLSRIARRGSRTLAEAAFGLGPAAWAAAPSVLGPLVARHDPRVALLLGLDRSRPEVTFVQVGSNDADAGDPLAPFLHSGTWAGLMIEPVGYVFERLVAKHGHNPRLAFENAAIAPTAGTRAFYHLAQTDDPDVPVWYDQLGSFDPAHLAKDRGGAIPDIERRVTSTEVRTLPFDDACAAHGVGALDLIHVDTEGFDLEVLKLVGWARAAPDVVMYESRHLSAEDAATAHELLDAFDAVETGGDTLAVRRSALAGGGPLAQAWGWVCQAVGRG